MENTTIGIVAVARLLSPRLLPCDIALQFRVRLTGATRCPWMGLGLRRPCRVNFARVARPGTGRGGSLVGEAELGAAARARLALVAVDPAVLEAAADARDLGGGALRHADAVVDLELAAHPDPVVAVDAARRQVAAGAGGELLPRAGPRGRRGAVADGPVALATYIEALQPHSLKASAPMLATEVGDRDRDQAGAVVEGLSADAGDQGGYLDRDQACAAEGGEANAGDRGGDGDRDQAATPEEGVVGDAPGARRDDRLAVDDTIGHAGPSKAVVPQPYSGVSRCSRRNSRSQRRRQAPAPPCGFSGAEVACASPLCVLRHETHKCGQTAGAQRQEFGTAAGAGQFPMEIDIPGLVA